MERIGLAVVGAGYWGPNLVRNAQATPQFRLEALCDLDEERARRVLGEYSTVRTCGSLDEVLADPRIDAVAIATPAQTHAPLALAALEAGKHVLVEKPLAANSRDGVRMVEAAADADRVLMVDHTYCYTPAVSHVRNLMREGVLGELQFLDSVRINLGLVQPDVDVLWDLAPHDLSILDTILPEEVFPVAVAAHGSDPIGAGKACVAYLTVWLSNGAIAHVHVNWLSPTKIRTAIVGGSKRTVVWDDLNPLQRVQVYDRGVDRTHPETLSEDSRTEAMISYRMGEMVAPALREGEALRAMMAEFASSIQEQRAPLTDGSLALRVLTILEAASLSAAEGGRRVELGSASEPLIPQPRVASIEPVKETV